MLRHFQLLSKPDLLRKVAAQYSTVSLEYLSRTNTLKKSVAFLPANVAFSSAIGERLLRHDLVVGCANKAKNNSIITLMVCSIMKVLKVST
jgi:hypothetical protein